MTIQELSEAGIAGFRIQEIIEVYYVDTDGRKAKTIGFFQNPHVAEAFGQNQTDPEFVKTEEVWVLTNGKDAVVLREVITLSSDEEAQQEARAKALEKLSLSERKVLGL